MMQVASCVRQCPQGRSLVLLDEPCHGTHAPEAAALCWALVEALVEKGARLVLATHFMPLTRMARLYGGIKK